MSTAHPLSPHLVTAEGDYSEIAELPLDAPESGPATLREVRSMM